MKIGMKGLEDIFKKRAEILFAYLYGSAARGEAGKGSDIDIGVFVKNDFKPEPFYEVKISEEVENLTGLKNVEVVVLNGKPLRFLNQVLRHGKLLFSRDERARVLFETYVTKAYIDMKPYYREYDEMRLKS
ncbi:MAG: nucleotidyltransferase domain-containing protein [Candidatus Aenigmatarchaeota archaeon]|nr:MAG: nucleotidyltransferase domain-containing protein [Candidatus Aenigmarchaeota archaeon]